MPKIRSRHAKVLEDLQEQSKQYSEKATLLSNLLLRAEQFLRQMPGKIMIRTESENPDYDLAFDRDGGNWRLELWHFNDNDMRSVPVAQANIMQKAIAATLLPELYERLIRTFAQGQVEIDRGLESLKGLPFLDFDEFTRGADKGPTTEGSSDDLPF